MSTSKRNTGATSRATHIPNDFELTPQLREWGEKKGYGPYMQAHFDFFIDHAKSGSNGKPVKYIDWEAAFRKAVVSDWGDVRRNMGRNGVAPQKVEDPACRRTLPTGELCGMPGRTHPVYGYSCDHCNRKDEEKRGAKTEMPPHVREALARFRGRTEKAA